YALTCGARTCLGAPRSGSRYCKSGIRKMYVRLVSEDRDLYKLCRESFAEIPGPDWHISAVANQEDVEGFDLWLWDYHPAMVLPEYTTHSPSKHLFLVHRKDLAGFRSCASADAHILLKPVTRRQGLFRLAPRRAAGPLDGKPARSPAPHAAQHKTALAHGHRHVPLEHRTPRKAAVGLAARRHPGVPGTGAARDCAARRRQSDRDHHRSHPLRFSPLF